MDAIRWYFQEQLPNYLRSIPLPKTVADFATLTREQWLQILPLLLFLLVLLWMLLSPIFSSLCKRKEKRPKHVVNKRVKKDEEKVVDTVDIESIGDEKAFCRCWKSKKFPYCDGSHNHHNQNNDDNVGPLVIKSEKKRERKK